jgi:hypothetical protein
MIVYFDRHGESMANIAVFLHFHPVGQFHHHCNQDAGAK